MAKLLPDAVLTDVAELDITNLSAVQKFVADNKIGTIINCAAYTAVDKAEDDIELATKINVEGPENLAKTGCKIIHISTDYVFDGKKEQTELYKDLFNKENTINNSFININEKNINLSTKEKNRTP